MKISVIVPVYNAEKTLERCVDSLLKQKNKEIEIILVDDHSTDSSLTLCKQLEKCSSRIIVYQTDGKGVSAARNTGLYHATGDIIGFCDADDMYELNALSIVEKMFIKKTDIDILTTGFYYSHFKDRLIIDETKNYQKEYAFDSCKMLEMVLVDNRIMGSVWNKFYKATVIDKIKFEKTLTHCEDMHFNIKVLEGKPNCYIVKQPVYHYIYNDQSATNSMERLFDNQGNSKYIVAMKSIEEMCCFNKRAKIAVKYKTVTIAIDLILHNNLTNDQVFSLMMEIKKNTREFFLSTFRYFEQGGFKWFAKFIVAIFKCHAQERRNSSRLK